MGIRPTCPKESAKGSVCDPHRVYCQVPKTVGTGPKARTFSTSVSIPYVYCGTNRIKDGKGVLTVGKGQHGLQPFVAPRASRGSTKTAKKAPRKPAKPSKPHKAAPTPTGGSDGSTGKETPAASA
jgi:hypothetical protein